MIDPSLKRILGQMTYGVAVVACSADGVTRGFTSTWVMQASFDEPVVIVSSSPRHDTYALIAEQRWFTVSILAGDQIEEGQYFSYPGRRFKHLGDYFEFFDGAPAVKNAISWFRCDLEDELEMLDHRLLVGRVTAVGEGRLKEPGLTYSSRKGWKIADAPARQPGESVRDRLLERLEAHEQATEGRAE
jgi:flavin reductase (DIM6/NTAB) family NADH-FMN oxidoreductase RutF